MTRETRWRLSSRGVLDEKTHRTYYRILYVLIHSLGASESSYLQFNLRGTQAQRRACSCERVLWHAYVCT